RAGGVWLCAARGRSAPGPAPRPAYSTWPLAVGPAAPTAPVSPPAQPSSSPAAPERTAPERTVPEPAPAAPTAAPFVQSFAQLPGVPPQRPLPSPTGTHYVPSNVDGCDHNYGTITQCVPWTFPAGTADRCAWLTAHGFEELRVAGGDRQKLDEDGNGVACD
ncbi:hypothetical protein AB0F10_30685, partial [Actinoplanes sp. NPDC026623]